MQERGRRADIVTEGGGGLLREAAPHFIRQCRQPCSAITQCGKWAVRSRAGDSKQKARRGGFKRRAWGICLDETRGKVGWSLSLLSVMDTGRMWKWWQRQRQTCDLLCWSSWRQDIMPCEQRGVACMLWKPGAATVSASPLPTWLTEAKDAANLCPDIMGLLAIPSKEKNQMGWVLEYLCLSAGRSYCHSALWSCSDLQVSPIICGDANLDLPLREKRSMLSCWSFWSIVSGWFCWKVWMLGNSRNAGTTRKKESTLGFDNELRNFELTHCGHPKPKFPFCVEFFNMSTWSYSLWQMFILIKNNMSTSTVL